MGLCSNKDINNASYSNCFSDPNRIEDVIDKRALFDHLKDNNETMMKVTRAFHYMFFATLALAFGIITPIIKHFKIDKTIE